VNEQDSGSERHINIHLSPEIMGGSTRTSANVSHSDYEFTVTFARVDHEVEAEEVPGSGRLPVNLSPRFMRELIDAMEDNYSKWQTREGIKNLPEYGGGESGASLRADAARAGRRRRTGRRGTPGCRWCSYPAVMKVAVVSDIHANRQAFEATLEASPRARPRSCGASATSSATEPTRMRAWSWRVSTRRVPRGNHDMAVTGELSLDEFSRGASVAAQWTREVIAPENLDFLRTLSPQARSRTSASTTRAA